MAKYKSATRFWAAGDDIAGYDPEQDADLYEYWKAEARYWEAG